MIQDNDEVICRAANKRNRGQSHSHLKQKMRTKQNSQQTNKEGVTRRGLACFYDKPNREVKLMASHTNFICQLSLLTLALLLSRLHALQAVSL